jgi:hypothetical protein
MSYSLLEKALICSFNRPRNRSKSVEGIINKVIKNNNLKSKMKLSKAINFFDLGNEKP